MHTGFLQKGGDLLLEADRTETSVESSDTLVLQHLAETTNETVGVGRLRDETDTGGLERAQGDIGEELGGGGGGEVDGSAVVGGGLVAEVVDALLLEELVSTELQGALEEVTGEGRADTSQEGTSTLILDDLAETTDQTAVVGGGVELDASLDAVDCALVMCSLGMGWHCRAFCRQRRAAKPRLQTKEKSSPAANPAVKEPRKHVHIDGSQSTVGDGAADGTSKSETRVQSQTLGLGRLGGLDLLDDGFNLGGHCELEELK